MTAGLGDADVLAALDRIRTCEFATVNRTGVPLAWPTLPMYRPDDGTFVITTSIGLPHKAYNVRRNPQVALLYSDPTGSGLDSMPEVLIQGEANCSSEIVTSPKDLEEYWIRVLERQPAGQAYGDHALTRRLMGWYYRRLVITIRPTRVHVRESVRQRAPTSPGQPSAARSEQDGGTEAYADVARRLAGFTSGVLTGLDPQGAPWLIRVRPEPDHATGRLKMNVPPGELLSPGPGSLLCHSHDERVWKLRSFVAMGELEGVGDRWELTPARVIAGPDGNPIHTIQSLRESRRAEQRYLQRRGMPAPPVPWDEYEPLKAEAKRRQGAR
jgi:hypothetical protein